MAYDGAQAGTRLAGPAPGFVRIVVFICALMAADLAFAWTERCPDWNVSIHSVDGVDTGIACEAAEKALGFLSAHGVDTAGAVEMHLANALPAPADPKAFGCYDQVARRAYMLVFPEFLKQDTWSDLPVDRALYRSMLTHEIAHAVAAANFEIPGPSVRAHEYVAYVTMLATMSPGQRADLLARFPGQGYVSAGEMNTTFYLIAPFRFAAEAYRHFVKPGNGKTFLAEVLAGRALVGEDGP